MGRKVIEHKPDKSRYDGARRRANLLQQDAESREFNLDEIKDNFNRQGVVIDPKTGEYYVFKQSDVSKSDNRRNQ